MTGPIRIAMWSGPRNLSTTMMRSFGARADTACVDEPFYAAFLRLSDEVHPLQDEIFAAHEADPVKVIASLTENEAPDGKPVFYQKHMNHHMVDGIPMDWLGRIDHHVMLVRHPARVIASYQRKMETLSLEAIGAPQQFALWQRIGAEQGRLPPVVDADRILAEPEAVLKRLCAAIDLPWDAAMLNWPSGPRAEDGAWAPHWYDAVWSSTGFGAPPGDIPKHTGQAAEIEAAALPLYKKLLTGHV